MSNRLRTKQEKESTKAWNQIKLSPVCKHTKTISEKGRWSNPSEIPTLRFVKRKTTRKSQLSSQNNKKFTKQDNHTGKINYQVYQGTARSCKSQGTTEAWWQEKPGNHWSVVTGIRGLFFAGGCLGWSRAERPSVSWTKMLETFCLQQQKEMLNIKCVQKHAKGHRYQQDQNT